jgi:thiamine-phosphate pyrophosphorylase
MMIDWRLCFIADAEASAGKGMLNLIAEAVAGGATLVQLRAKTWRSRDLFEAGLEARRLLKARHIPLIINDRADIALAVGSDGVHLGQEDLPAREARRILGKGKIIGVSASTVAEALSAEEGGADYIGAGPVFSTSSKGNLPPFVGIKGIRKIRAAVKIPVLAIGGITAANAGRVISAGADGVAVISAIARSSDPRRAASELIETIGKVRKRRLAPR